MRLRPALKEYAWSFDFVQDRTVDGKVFRMLCVIDEYTAIRGERKLRSGDVLAVLDVLFVRIGAPEHIRSDNEPEFTAAALRDRLQRIFPDPFKHLALAEGCQLRPKGREFGTACAGR